jgi:hypothetical protein
MKFTIEEYGLDENISTGKSQNNNNRVCNYVHTCKLKATNLSIRTFIQDKKQM